LRWASGGIAFLAAIALWLLPMVLFALNDGDAQHRAYLDEILFRQTAGRYASSTIHPQPAWYFLEVIVLFWMPFSLALPWLGPRWRDAWRERSATGWLPLGWSLVVYDGRRYAVTRSVHGDGRSESILAEALDGSDLVSANLYRLDGEDALKPCEMPEQKVLAFLRDLRPAGGA
jgi:hypothetical protein